MRLAVLYLSEDLTDEAINAASEVIRLRPKNPWGHAIQGLAYMVAGEIDLAETAFEAALHIDADYGLAICELAAMKETKGQREAAIQLYERALLIDGLTDAARAGYSITFDGRTSAVAAKLKCQH
jgi:Tfp pilus assembly protein PilF